MPTKPVNKGFLAYRGLFKLVFYIRTNAYKVYYQFVLCVFYDWLSA